MAAHANFSLIPSLLRSFPSCIHLLRLYAILEEMRNSKPLFASRIIGTPFGRYYFVYLHGQIGVFCFWFVFGTKPFNQMPLKISVVVCNSKIFNNLEMRILCFIGMLVLSVFAQAQQSEFETIYRRSSLFTLMINEPERLYANEIEATFMASPIPDKFNDHNLGIRQIPNAVTPGFGMRQENIALQETNIRNFLAENKVARDLVAKWFNRDEKGTFEMGMIADRGMYNASEMDVKLARSSERGLALLADAGEELINNTFVLVNDFDYVSKEEVADKAKAGLALLKDLASLADKEIKTDGANAVLTVFGKGYVVRTTAYLYKLVWNDSIAAVLYEEYWMDRNSPNYARKQAFENSDIFRLELVGYEVAWADLQSTIFTTKTEEELISIATIRAIDAVIAKLQRKYEVFRTKTPLINNNPLAAKIGLKEGLEKGDKFEVLEQVMDKQGRTSYKRRGIIRVEKDGIWDNRYMASEEQELTNNLVPGVDYTVFKGDAKHYIGWLIRQIN
jgi:hypothetical protein